MAQWLVQVCLGLGLEGAWFGTDGFDYKTAPRPRSLLTTISFYLPVLIYHGRWNVSKSGTAQVEKHITGTRIEAPKARRVVSAEGARINGEGLSPSPAD